MRIDVHIHQEPDGEILALLRDIAVALTQGVDEIMADLTTLQTAVSRVSTVEQSAVELIKQIAAQLAASASDPAAVQALADELNAHADALAAAVTENTPAAGSTPTSNPAPAPNQPPTDPNLGAAQAGAHDASVSTTPNAPTTGQRASGA